MKIPRELLPEILARHQKGQSDSAIVRWLATLDPPIAVVRLTVRQARMLAAKQAGAGPERKPAKVVPLFPGKASGSQNRKRQKAEKEREQADHEDRGEARVSVKTKGTVDRAHLYQLEVLLDLQQKINDDEIMTLPDKVRHSTQIAQAMAKVRNEAELERRIEELEHQRAVEVEELAADQRANEVEKRRLEAERRQLDAEWAKVRSAQGAA